jgi:hypothetical protein
MKIPETAYDRILKAVGPKVVLLKQDPDSPPDPNKVLTYRIPRDISYYYAAVESRSAKTKAEQLRALELLSESAAELKERLELVDDQWEDWENQNNIYELGQLLSRVKSRSEVLKWETEWGPNSRSSEMVKWRALNTVLRTRSPFEWLAGTCLPETYTNCFGEKPTLARRSSDNKLDSPFIRFVEQVLIEFKITNSGRPCGREAIARALTDARKNRFRRKEPPR